MRKNSTEKMGFSKETKLLIIHADDAGLSHSQNMATIQSLKNGLVNSYSIMVPCPWFYEIAMFAKKNSLIDNGIHLTLTCEWQNYKFGPVLPVTEVPSLVDDNGHFYRSREELRNNASTEEVKRELEAQIDKALKYGLKPTHIDSHMYSVGASPTFFKVYKELGAKYHLPVLINSTLLKMVGLEPTSNIEELDFVIDNAFVADLEIYKAGALTDYYSDLIDNLDSGINLLLIHPAFDDHEMKGITINHPNFGSDWRKTDFDFFNSKENKLKLQQNNIELITWKDLSRIAPN